MDIREQLAAVRCFLLDMDGTFYLGNQLIEGSLDFLQALHDTGRQCLFLTNNSSKSASFYQEKLARMGVPEEFRHVLTSGQATARYVTNRFPGKKAFLLANQIETMEMEALGVQIDQEHPDYVLIAFDTELDYKKMTMLCDHVRAGLPYIATHPDFNCPTETGFMPDIGAIMAFIEASTGRRPDLIVGKPHTGIVEAVLRRTGLKTSELAMVGDRLYTDIETGLRSGMLSILVMSGETTEAMLAESHTVPDLKFGRLSDMIPLL